MREFLTNLLNFFGLAFWVKILTEDPICTYYFGPFLTASEADNHKAGYLEDIESEGTRVLSVSIKRCKPSCLTVIEDPETTIEQPIVAAFNPQS
ncbi:MAG: DUF1816 domain-containing protein [Cyanobacteria bacterium J06592_8]